MPSGAGNFYGLDRFEGNRPLIQQLTAARLNTILDAIDQGVIRYGRGMYGTRTTGGATVNTRRNYISPVRYPYRGRNASTGGTCKVVVKWGTHNSIVPTIDGTPLVVTGTPPKLTVNPGDQIVYVQCDFDASSRLVTASLHSSSDPAPPTNVINMDGSGTGYETLFGIAAAVTNGVAYVAIAQGVMSIRSVQLCGNKIIFGS